MATDLTQDTVLQFLRSGGGSVKNADLLLHFRNFIRDNPDRVRLRDLFKKYVNTLATVQQLDGVSYVVLRRKFKGRVPGGGDGGSSGPPPLSPGMKGEPSPGNARVSPAVSAEKPRQKPQLSEVTASAPTGVTATKTILPAAGIMLNNNNNVETNLNLKQQPEINKAVYYVAPTAGQTPRSLQPSGPEQSSKIGQNMGFGPAFPVITPVISTVRHQGETRQQIPVKEPLRGREAEPKTPNFSEPNAQDWSSKVGQQKVGFGPLDSRIKPVTSAVRHHQETIPVREPLRGREPERGLHEEPPLHQEPPLHREPPLHQEPPPQQKHLLHQEPPLHQERLLHKEPPLHQGPPPQQKYLLHQGPPPQQKRLLHKEPPLHQEPPPEQKRLLHQGPPLHQEPPPLHQEPPPQQKRLLHQEPPPLHQEPPPQQVNLNAQVVRRHHRHRKSYKSAVSYDEDEADEEEEEVPVRRCSAGGEWPLSVPLGDTARAFSASSPCIIDVPSIVSSSSSDKTLPKIYIQDVEEEKLPPRGGPGWSMDSGAGPRGQWSGPALENETTRRSLPLESDRYMPSPEIAPHYNVDADRHFSQSAAVQLQQRQGAEQSHKGSLSSSTSIIYSPSSDSGLSIRDWPMSSSPRGSGWNSSLEDLHVRTGNTRGDFQIQEVLQRAQKSKDEPSALYGVNKIQAPWHHSAGHLHDDQEPKAHFSHFYHSNDQLHDNQSAARVMPKHLSTGDLFDDDHHQEAAISDGSTSSPPMRQHSGVPRRLSSHLRSRMCRSMGADLDQLMQEEMRGGGGGGGSEAARLNRLHMISSSLSLHYDVSSSSLSSCSTPPRSHSLANLTEGMEGRKSLPVSSSTAPPEGSSRQSQIPLESREHDWLVKGAAGAWPDIYSLFRDDSSLLNRRDFISGFTVLHWIAKHGDHRVLNTLWYGVQKAGLSFDINARSTCGHTPLHIAAMHGHKNIIRLLVSKFGAHLKLRDTAGKKPWQYLSRTSSPEVFQLLGAPPRAALGGGDVEGGGGGGGGGGVKRVESMWKHGKHQRRRQKHHLSSASSAGRPLDISAKVKRSSSIAAFLKHKSLRHFHGHQSDSSI